jgi:hypothetical protein
MRLHIVIFAFFVFLSIVFGELIEATLQADHGAALEAEFAPVAFHAILGGVAGEVLGGEFLAVLGVGDIDDGVPGKNRWVAIDVLRGDLKAVEEVAGALGIEFAGTHLLEDHAQRHENGRPVFRKGQLEGARGGGAFFEGETVQAVMVVAVRRFAKRCGSAFVSVGLDVAAFSVHTRILSIPHPPGLAISDLFSVDCAGINILGKIRTN